MSKSTGPDPYDEDIVMARRDLANTIAQQAEALALDKIPYGQEYAQVAKLFSNVEMLRAWTPDDRRP